MNLFRQKSLHPGLRQNIALITAALILTLDSNAQDKNMMVRIAKIEVYPAQLTQYKQFLKEEIETSVRIEKGVLSLSAVQEKEHPERITILEVYANQAAYKSHIETAHFKKYKTGTATMIHSLELVETDPIVLGKK